jgi:hypothetical protein
MQTTGLPALQYLTHPSSPKSHSTALHLLKCRSPIQLAVRTFTCVHAPHLHCPSTVHLHFTISHLTYPIRSRKASRRCCVPFKRYLLVLLSFEFPALEPRHLLHVERKENSELQASSPPEAQLLHRTKQCTFSLPSLSKGKSKQGNTNAKGRERKGGASMFRNRG